MILSGLNEGTWPALPQPDPWLAPGVRAELDLPGLDRRIGLAAHDFSSGLGAPDVLITRARRDASAPAVASRFWLRLKAMSGREWTEERQLGRWARALDVANALAPSPRPEPRPPVHARPQRISVTEVDRLKADPYAFYARRYLGLSRLDPVDADPSAAWRGTAVHAILEAWAKEDDCDPAKLGERTQCELMAAPVHPMMRMLWYPRLMSAMEWIAGRVAEEAAQGRKVAFAEVAGKLDIAGVTLSGKADRIDRLPRGALAIVDYKTGKPPSAAMVAAGFSLQLGLIGLMAEQGAFDGIARGAQAEAFEYWTLQKQPGSSQFGRMASPVDPTGARGRVKTDEFVAMARRHFVDAVEHWLTGNAAFTAKLRPDLPSYDEYDQLMRLEEWYGRTGRAGGEAEDV
jgi:ATP-dependent helicase/nuclease subunit B